MTEEHPLDRIFTAPWPNRGVMFGGAAPEDRAEREERERREERSSRGWFRKKRRCPECGAVWKD